MKPIQLMPITAFPVLFLYTREDYFEFTRWLKMFVELNTNLIYKN